MAEPPSLAGGVQVTVAVLFPRVAVASRRAPGAVDADMGELQLLSTGEGVGPVAHLLADDVGAGLAYRHLAADIGDRVVRLRSGEGHRVDIADVGARCRALDLPNRDQVARVDGS